VLKVSIYFDPLDQFIGTMEESFEKYTVTVPHSDISYCLPEGSNMVGLSLNIIAIFDNQLDA